MDKRKAEDVATMAATNLSAMIIDATPRIHGYLNGTATDVAPLGTTVILIAIGARHCGLSEAKIAKLLLKLDADGAFGGERAAPTLTKFAIVTSAACRAGKEERLVWEKAIATLGEESTTTIDLADAVVVLEADVAAVQSVRMLNPDARIAAILPKVDSMLQQAVRSAGADHVYFPLESSDSIKFVLEDVLRRM